MISVPGFVLNELSAYSVGHSSPAGYSFYIYGVVGSGKTQYVKDLIRIVRHRVLIFDYEGEYTEYPEVRVALPRSLLTVDVVQDLLNTDAAYTEYVADYLRGEDVDLEELTKSQRVHFERAVRRLGKLMSGDDLITALNTYDRIRVVPVHDFRYAQLVLLVSSLLNRWREIRRDRIGTLVVLEESEGLERYDTRHAIPSLIFQGRKRGIVFLLIGHRSPAALRKSAWGRDVLSNMFGVYHFEKGVLVNG